MLPFRYCPFCFKRKNKRAQAFYEFLWSLWVLPLFIAIIISITRVGVAKLCCLQAARHGAFLMATGKVKDNVVKNEVKQFMKDSGFDDSSSRLTVKPEIIHIGIGCPAAKVTVTYKVKVFDIGKLSFWGGKDKLERVCEEHAVCGKLAKYGAF